MQVNRLEFDRFRNLVSGVLVPCDTVNVIAGENAQGKTNVLEAIWLFTGGRSFRHAPDKELVAFGAEESRLTMAFTAAGREQTAQMTIRGRRSVKLNGVALPSAAKLAGTFCGVVFSPAHLSLIKDGPGERRRFIDAAYCQLRPSYIKTLSEYNRLLAQRNALCKAQNGDEADELFELWDRQLAQSGCILLQARQRYIKRLIPEAATIYRGLSGGRETFDMQIVSTVAATESMTLSETAAVLYDALRSHRKDDKAAGFTTVGPHRDDVEVVIDGHSARRFGSQGQQRSAVLAMKLAEATLLQDVTGERPVALLDDVMSELDVSRQTYILNHLHDWQVFITCCDPATVGRLERGKEFTMNNGVLQG